MRYTKVADARSITLQDDGFQVWKEGQVCFQAAWRDIQRVTAFKADLHTVDQVRLLCELDSSVSCLITEDFGGWKEFVKVMEVALNLRGEWLEEVTYPPFEECRSVIFERHF